MVELLGNSILLTVALKVGFNSSGRRSRTKRVRPRRPVAALAFPMASSSRLDWRKMRRPGVLRACQR
jgi:hypothetical protein